MFRKLFFALSLFMLLTACSPSVPDSPDTTSPDEPVDSNLPSAAEPTNTPIQGDVVRGQAVIDSLDVLILESFPVQVNAVVTGNLPDGCTSIDTAAAERAGSTFTIVVSTVRPADALCTEALVPFERVVSLDVLGLAAGNYTVNAGGRQSNFELAVDNTTGEVEPIENGTITGKVWHDLCAVAGGEGGEPAVPSDGCVETEAGGFIANGIYESGEPQVDGPVVVSLGIGGCPSAGLNEVMTDSSGEYQFDGLMPGTYCVSIDLQNEENSGVLIPGQWTMPDAQEAQVSVDLDEGGVVLIDFGWDYEFAPDPGEVGLCSNEGSFVTDVTVEDDTVLPAGQPFMKTWRLRNDGTCTWTTDYTAVFESGDQMAGISPTPLPEEVAPGETIDLTIEMTSPDIAGTYEGHWLLADASGQTFGLGARGDGDFYVRIVVDESTATGGLAELGAADWRDTFENTSGWFLLDNDNYVWELEDDGLLLRARQLTATEQWGLSSRNPLKNFYLEATVTNGENCSGLDRYGFLIRAPEPGEGYVLNFSCDGRYRLYKWDGTTYSPLKEWTASGQIMSGPGKTNRIGVWAAGSTFQIFANGILIDELTDSSGDVYDEGRFGLLIGAPQTANVEFLVEEVSYWILDD